MVRVRCFAFAICTLVCCTLFADAQGDDIKAILKKAIEAHGGEALLSKYHAGTSKFKGKLKVLNMDIDMTGETYFQKPDKLRNVLSLSIMDKNVDIVQVFDGKSFWVSTMGKTMEIKDDKIIKELRESLRAEGGTSFIDILQGGYDLTSVGEVKVKGKDAVGILVAKKGQRDITYFFDKKSHLVVKIEQRTIDGMSGQEYTQEKFITEYQVKDGLKVGKTVDILKDGEPYINIEITEVRVAEKLDAALFAKP